MPTEVTPGRGYPKPHEDNVQTVDVGRLRAALTAIDSDMVAALAAISALDALVDARIGEIIAGAPSTLDTLAEIAAALGSDPNLAATLTAAIATKASSADMATAIAARQPLSAILTALAALAPAADRLAYFTGADTVALAALTAYGRGLLGAADAMAARALLELVLADAGAYRAKTAGRVLTADQVYAAADYVTLSEAQLTAGIDLATGINFRVTLTAARTMGPFVAAVAGQSGCLDVVQDGTGGRTLSFDASIMLPDDVAPSVDTTAGRRNLYAYHCRSATDVVVWLVARGYR